MGSEADRQLPDRRGRKADTEPAPDALSAILGLWAKSRQAAHDLEADAAASDTGDNRMGNCIAYRGLKGATWSRRKQHFSLS